MVRGGAGIFRLAALDLDGTLLRSDGTVSDRTRRALAAARDGGVVPVLVTARPPRSVREVAAALGVGGVAICANGATVYDLDRERIVRHRPLASEVAGRLVAALRQRAPGIVFAAEVELRLHLEPGFPPGEWELPSDARWADAAELVAEPVTKLVVRHDEHDLEELERAVREVVGEDGAVTVSGRWAVEIAAAGVNKAAALAELAAELGISAAETIAFGDYPNDLPMLEWAGHAVAPANAHPRVLEAVDEVTASNDDDGVALVLERLVAAGS